MHKLFNTYPKDDSSIVVSINQKRHVKMHKEKHIDAEPYQLKNTMESSLRRFADWLTKYCIKYKAWGVSLFFSMFKK